MQKEYVLPYQVLLEGDWTVDSLMILQEIKKDKRIPLSDYVSINNKPVSSLDTDNTNPYPYVEIKNIDAKTRLLADLEMVECKDRPSRARLIAHPGDIVLSTIRPERGSLAIVPNDYKEYIVSNALAVLTPINISSELLFFILSHPKTLSEFGSLARGVTIPTLSIKTLKDYQLPLTKIPKEQNEKAVKYYNKWLEANRSNRELPIKIEETFQEMLIDVSRDEDNIFQKYKICRYANLQIRFDVNFHILQQKIQWNCNIVRFEELVTYRNIRELPSKNPYFQDTTPIIKIQNLEENTLELHDRDLKLIEITENGEGKQHLIYKDIVVPKHGGKLRRTNLVSKSLQGAITNQHLYTIEVTKEEVLPEFLAMFLKTKWAQEYIDLNVGGTVQSIIKRNTLNEILVPVPDLGTQRRMLENVLTFLADNEVIEEQKQSIDKFTLDLLDNEKGNV